jgi:chromosome partitioning protein
VRQHRRASGRGKPDVLIIPARIDKRTSAGRDAVATLAALTEPVAPVVSYRAIVADSLATGEPVPADSPSAAEFSALADAVLTRLEMN